MFKNSFITRFYKENVAKIEKHRKEELKALRLENASKAKINGCHKRHDNEIKNLENRLKAIDEAEKPQNLKISMDWKDSLYGWCPTGFLFENWASIPSFKYRAGGCGYCKLSACLARLLCKHDFVMKCLIKAYYKKDEKPYGVYMPKYKNLVDFPFIDSGIGENATIRAMQYLGFTLDYHNQGKKWDSFAFTYKGKIS